MILRFRHKGLRRFFEAGSTAGIQAKHAARLRLILTLLATQDAPSGLDRPGLRLHALRGDRAGLWAVDVAKNWRVTFRYEGMDATDVDYEDYH